MQNSMHSSSIHTVARSVVIINGQVLLVHCKGASNTFLPGGHVEYGESAISALKREFNEECQIGLNVTRFLGTIEHIYHEKETLEHEINLCFLSSMPTLKDIESIESKEEHLEFHWAPVNKLSEYNLQPHPLQFLIPKISNQKDSQPWFESTIKG